MEPFITASLQLSSNSITIVKGRRDVVHCTAYGVPRPTVTWFRDGAPVGNPPYVSQYLSVVNESTVVSYLVFENVRSAEAGNYHCRASNNTSTLLDIKILTVEIIVPVSITLSTNAIEISTSPSSPERVICRASGIPRPTVSWMRNGQEVSTTFSSGVYQTPPAVLDSSVPKVSVALVLSMVDFSDGGVYVCVARNDIRVQEELRILLVLIVAPASTRLSTQTITIVKGENETVRCTGFGVPLPSVTWMRDGVHVVNSPFISQHNRNFNNSAVFADLVFQSIRTEEAGRYQCQASNRISTSNVKTLTVEVLAPASLRLSSRSITVVKGEHDTVRCTAFGVPRPTVNWFRNGSPVVNSQFIIQYQTNFNDSIVVADLVFQDVRNEEAGTYECQASNRISSSPDVKTLSLEVLSEQTRRMEIQQYICTVICGGN